MEPGPVSAPFDSAAWTFALSTTGYRMLAELDLGCGARPRSRRRVDATRWVPEVARALAALRLPDGGVLRRERIAGAEGHWLCRQAQALGREALHAHRVDAPYVAGPSIMWLSIPVSAAAPDPTG